MENSDHSGYRNQCNFSFSTFFFLSIYHFNLGFKSKNQSQSPDFLKNGVQMQSPESKIILEIT